MIRISHVGKYIALVLFSELQIHEVYIMKRILRRGRGGGLPRDIFGKFNFNI